MTVREWFRCLRATRAEQLAGTVRRLSRSMSPTWARLADVERLMLDTVRTHPIECPVLRSMLRVYIDIAITELPADERTPPAA